MHNFQGRKQNCASLDAGDSVNPSKTASLCMHNFQGRTQNGASLYASDTVLIPQENGVPVHTQFSGTQKQKTII
jgi:hypothetical protein